jgi:hypothetical protein
MGIMSTPGMLDSLRQAQDELNVRLDAILIELRTIHVLLEGLRGGVGEPSDDPVVVG